MSLFTKKVGLCAALFLGAQCALAQSECKKAGFQDTPYGGCVGMVVTVPAVTIGGGIAVSVSGANIGAVSPGKIQLAVYTASTTGQPELLAVVVVPPAPAETSFGAGPSVVLADNQSAKIQLLAPAGCDAQWQGCQNTPAPDSDPGRQLTLYVAYQTIGDTPDQLEGLAFPTVEIQTPDGTVITVTRRPPAPSRPPLHSPISDGPRR